MLFIVVMLATLAVVLCSGTTGNLGQVPEDVFRTAIGFMAIAVTVFGLSIGLVGQFAFGKWKRYRPKAPQGDFVVQLRFWGWVVLAIGLISAFLIAHLLWSFNGDTHAITPGLPFLGLVAAGTAASGMGYMLGSSMRTWGGSYAYWRKPRKI